MGKDLSLPFDKRSVFIADLGLCYLCFAYLCFPLPGLQHHLPVRRVFLSPPAENAVTHGSDSTPLVSMPVWVSVCHCYGIQTRLG